MRAGPVLFSGAVFICLWLAASTGLGTTLVPTPWQTLIRSREILTTESSWLEIGLTLARGCAGLLISFSAAIILGIPAGLNRRVMDMISPLIAALQSCPAIVWITLLMVFWGAGTSLPAVVAAAALFPPLFANAAEGAASLDRRLLALARLHKTPAKRILLDLVLPGMEPFFLAGLSYAFGAVWRVATMAEFLGSSRGVGARIYWSYRLLDMPALFFWAGLVILWGLILEWGAARPLRAGLERKRHD